MTIGIESLSSEVQGQTQLPVFCVISLLWNSYTQYTNRPKHRQTDREWIKMNTPAIKT